MSPCWYIGWIVHMDHVDMATFEIFFEWSLMLRPELKEYWTLEQILPLAQLGQTYQVFALKDQVASRFRECLVSKPGGSHASAGSRPVVDQSRCA